MNSQKLFGMYSRMSLLCGQLRKLHIAIIRSAQARAELQFVSYEDSRLQNYLKSLKDQYLLTDARAMKNNLYSNDSLRNIISLVQDIDVLNSELKELDAFVSELQEQKDEMLAAAQTEKRDMEDKLSDLKSALLHHLIPYEIEDEKDIVMELTPGVGGQEAMLFNKDMFDMYCSFADWKGWMCEVLKYEETGIGGLRNGHIAISGCSAYKILKYESGVHRVQRIPKTEKAGRIHTSTATVAVLPQPSNIDITINPSDIEMEFKRSGGAGGQSVNTTDSCVRLYHKPTGIMVESQIERCQHKNRELAMKSLRAKLYERELEARTKETTFTRKVQVGTAARSEKVRTYNFVQDRITDHRAHIQMHGIESFFSGGELLERLIQRLQEWNSVTTLHELLSRYGS